MTNGATHGRRILFLSYWSLREPLNASAVFPYLRILSERDDVERVDLVTLETSSGPLPTVMLNIPKVRHIALYPPFARPHLLAKGALFLRSISTLARHIRRERIDLVIAKGSLAGALADIVHSLTGGAYNVESYEPHSLYMVECGVWHRSSLRFRFLNFMEERQVRRARHLITVTHNHRNDLIAQGEDPARVHVIPSITDLERFQFRQADRARVRTQLDIPDDAVVGTYVGKFGGLYYDDEAFEIFRKAFDRFPGMHLLVLSPTDPAELMGKANKAGLPLDRTHVLVVPHDEVPAYLSAADLAFSIIKPTPAKRYQCPIKNGEYWACGLPILMTDGISDDYLMMRQGIGGQVYGPDLHGLDEALDGIARMIAMPDRRERMRALAERFRSLALAREVYRAVI
jgi:glycosyltransferase involved in cell wall biosynthesis